MTIFPTLRPGRGLWLVLAPFALMASSAASHGQLLRPRNDWVYYRELHDQMGQSYSDVGPRGRGYYTPLFLPGIDDFNGPSRAYSPIFNAPQAAPRGSLMRPEALYPPPAPRAAGGAARPGLMRRLFRRR